MILRPYQRAALDATYDYWRRGGGNPLIVAPCGAGKSVIIAALVQEALTSWPGTRILLLTHRRELLSQDGAELQALWPEAPIGYYSAGLRRRDTTPPVLFAGIQSIHRRITDLDPFDLVLVDEAHLIPRSAETMYGSTPSNLKLMNPDTKVLGLTATPYRLDSGPLVGGLFDAVAYDIPVQRLIDLGHLVPVVARGGSAQADLSGVHRRAGEFVQGEVEAAFRRSGLVRKAVAEIVALGAERRGWLLYCSGVAHAGEVLAELEEHGIDAELVTGATPRAERDASTARFRAGALRALVNVDVLTTGANFPACDLIALLRATDSAALYVQIVGRGMRVSPGKADCLLLDYGGNVVRHGPIDAVAIGRARGEKGAAPAKECPQCRRLVAIGTRECPDCGWEWPEPEPRQAKHATKAYSGAVLKSQAAPVWIEVSAVDYRRHQKAGRPDSVQVRYRAGLEWVSEWWCPEHGGYAAEKTWARLRAGGWSGPRPGTVTELLAGVDSLRVPAALQLTRSGKYLEIKKYRYTAEKACGAELS